MQNFSGVWTALVTPMTETGVDYNALERLIESQVAGGVRGVVSVGTTGESPTLDPEEHLNVIKAVVRFAGGRIPVFAGTGSNCTKEAVYLTREADNAGADGFLVVGPYYNKPTQEGVFLHMSEVAKCTEKPIMLYSIPGRCGIEIANDTAIRLNEKFENIYMMKEAGGKTEKVADLHSRAADKILVFSGDDGLTVDFMKNGACGVVSVASNIIPEVMVGLAEACAKKNWSEAERIDSKYKGLFKKLFIEPNPVPAKAAMKMLGMMNSDFVRLPLCRMTSEHTEILRDELAAAGLLK